MTALLGELGEGGLGQVWQATDTQLNRQVASRRSLCGRGGLWAVPFDDDRLEIVGMPVPVEDGVHVLVSGGDSYAVAEDGTLIYTPARPVGGPQSLVWVHPDGTVESTPARQRGYGSTVSFSPDRSRVAVALLDLDESGNYDVGVV